MEKTLSGFTELEIIFRKSNSGCDLCALTKTKEKSNKNSMSSPCVWWKEINSQRARERTEGRKMMFLFPSVLFPTDYGGNPSILPSQG